jgi:hypothetical protein
MSEQKSCDFCGRFEAELPTPSQEGAAKLELGEDGLWVCHDCRARLLPPPVGEVANAELPEEIRALVGKSAGAICSVLNLPYEPPYRSVIDAAQTIAYDEDRYMSAWSFVSQWLDGTTVWRDEDGSATAIVTEDGAVQIEPR